MCLLFIWCRVVWDHLVASLMDCSYLALPLAYSMYNPRMFLRHTFMHSFSVGVSSLCLKVSMQVSKHLELRYTVSSWSYITIIILIEANTANIPHLTKRDSQGRGIIL